MMHGNVAIVGLGECNLNTVYIYIRAVICSGI